MGLFIHFRSAWSKIDQSRYRYRIKKEFEEINSYFLRYPALQFSLLFLIGTVFNTSVFLPILFLWLVCFYRNSLLLSILIPLLGFINFNLNKPTFLEEDNPKRGIGLFKIESIRSSFKGLYLYKGKFVSFLSENETYHNVYCTVAYRGKDRPIADYDYIIEGTLTNRSNRFISFKTKKNTKWLKSKKNVSLSEIRYKIKKKVVSFLSKNLQDSLSRALIISLITGEVDNKLLRFSFSRLGLSHVLAISGFHFALVVSFFSFFLSKILPKNFFLIALIIVSLSYFLFIGMNPSVLRAFTLVILYIFAKLIKKNAYAMNLMGVSILVNLIFIPKDIYHLGFQLSYLSYSAIIIFYPIFNDNLKKIIKDHENNSFSFGTKIVYQVLKYFRSAISLNFSVSLVVFPVLIFYFSKFPVYSLIYNLYIPLLISLLLYLTIFAFFIPFLFHCVNFFSSLLLRIIVYPPPICEYTLRHKDLSLTFLILFLALTFLYGIRSQQKEELCC